APLTFTASGILYPEELKDLKLVPFFNVHEARYMVYWPVVSRENLAERLKAIKEKEEKMLALEAQTVDQVAPGEQQPEAEHNFKGERTNSGTNQDFFWRDARGWFSYDLANTNKQGKILRLTYFGGDRDRNFDILINDQILATVNLDGAKGDTFYTVDYEIPEEILNNLNDDQMTLKFVAHKGSVAGGIYYIRLLKK